MFAFETRVIEWGQDGQITDLKINDAVAVSSGQMSVAVLRRNGKVTVSGYWATWGGSEELRDIVAIASGELVGIAVDKNQNLRSWGMYRDKLNPPDLALHDIVAVAADNSTGFNGPGHQLVLRADGRPIAWGLNWFYTDLYNIPTDLVDAIAISASFYYNMAIRRNGEFVQWGKGWYVFDDSFVSTLPPPQNLKVVSVSNNSNHALAATTEGNVVACGNLYNGVCNVPPNAKNIVMVSAGTDFSVALTESGEVITWGNDKWGGFKTPAGLKGAIAISAGRDSCAAIICEELASAAPYIYAQPGSRTAEMGQSTYFVVYPTGMPPFSYQWYRNNTKIAGAKSQVLYIENVRPEHAGEYKVEVANKHGAMMSEPATLNTKGILLDSPVYVPCTLVFGEPGVNYMLQVSTDNGITWKNLGTVPGTPYSWYYDYSNIDKYNLLYRLVK